MAAITLRPHLYKVPYKVLNLTPIIQVAAYPMAVVVRKEAPWNSFQELLTYAKDNPGRIKFATSGLYCINHLMLEKVARTLGEIKWSCVPSAGEAQSISMLLGGHIDFIACGATWLPHIQAGTLRALVTYGGKKKMFANVPTLQELGYTYAREADAIIIGPPELPGPIVKKLHDTFKKAMDEPRFEEATKRINLFKEYRSSEELGKYLPDYYNEWGVMLREIGIERKD